MESESIQLELFGKVDNLISLSDIHFKSVFVCNYVGISYRQLDYWIKQKILTPRIVSKSTGEIQANSKSGTVREFTFDDLVYLKAIKKLLDVGATLANLKQTINSLKNKKVDIKKCKFVVAGKNIYYSTTNEEFNRAITEYASQGVLCLDIEPFVEEIKLDKDKLVELKKEFMPSQEVNFVRKKSIV